MSITIILIIITVGISVYAWSNQDLMSQWIFHPYSVANYHQYYRFITSGFLHADWGHLIFNTLSFYFFASFVEELLIYLHGIQIGILLFLVLYIGGIIVSDIYTFIKERDNDLYHGLGASGGVSAVIFSSILLNPTNPIGFMLLPGVSIPGFIFGVLYLVYSYYQAKRMGDNINHNAHLYGAIYGFVITIFLVPGALGHFFREILSYRIF